MNYQIDPGAWSSVFAVPGSVVDQHIKLAGAVQLKVLLWFLRHMEESPSADAISQALGIQRPDVEDALLYWKESGLMQQVGSAPSSSASQNTIARKQETAPKTLVSSPAGSSSAPSFSSPARILSRPQKPTNAIVAQRMKESSEIALLMQEAQQILGRLINNGESATLLMIHDEFGLPVDVILMLLQYAVAAGKGNMRYIEKTAINWAEEEIFTHDKAEEKLRSLDEAARAWRVVESVLGTGRRAPTQAESDLAVQWLKKWNFSREMIQEAYERCINQTGKINLRYMNKILERWRAQGIFTLEQAKEEQSRKTQAKEKASYDIAAFENSGVFDDFSGR